MKSVRIVVAFLSLLAIISCKQGGKSYVYKDAKTPTLITLFPDSTFTREEETKEGVVKYNGIWHFINRAESLIETTTTGQGFQIWTLTPKEIYRIVGDTLIGQ